MKSRTFVTYVCIFKEFDSNLDLGERKDWEDKIYSKEFDEISFLFI